MWGCRSILFPIFLFVNLAAFGQAPATPPPAPPRDVGISAADRAKFDRLRSIDLQAPKEKNSDHPLLDPKKGIYRKPGKGEIETLAVAEPLLANHALFLKKPSTGIVKLNGDSSCVTDKDVVAADDKCVAFKMPGAGTAFSFRTETYRLPRLADVILIDGIFRTGGVFQQVVIGELGDVPIEGVTLDTKGMKFLIDLLPVENGDQFTQRSEAMSKGVWSHGILYRNGHRMKENSTYALRSIAYRGKYVRSVDGVQYDELEFDKRRDVIVVFRVVDKDANGNVTIVWNRLKDVEAPKLNVGK